MATATKKKDEEFAVSEAQYTRTRSRVKSVEERLTKIEAVLEQHLGIELDQLNADGEPQEPGPETEEPDSEGES